VGVVLKKKEKGRGEFEGRIEGKVAGLSRHTLKMIKRGIMSGSIRSGPSNPGRAILSRDAVFSVGFR
jgi:hypothetical protein